MGGVEVEMQGDSFHFAFAYARDAVVAAAEGQRALTRAEWRVSPIKVRIGAPHRVGVGYGRVWVSAS